MHLNNGGFAYDAFFRYSGVSLYFFLRSTENCFHKDDSFQSNEFSSIILFLF